MDELEIWKQKWENIYQNYLLGYGKRSAEKAYPTGKDQPEFFFKFLYPIRKIKKSDIVLEIGCGEGNWISNLYDKVKEIHGTDISETAIERARHFFHDENNVKLYATTDLLSTFDKKRFDIIYSITVFQHLPKHQILKYFSEAYQLLKTNGIFFFNTFNDCVMSQKDADVNDFDENISHFCISFEKEELENSLKNVGFTDIKIEFMRVDHPDPNYGWLLAYCKK